MDVRSLMDDDPEIITRVTRLLKDLRREKLARARQQTRRHYSRGYSEAIKRMNSMFREVIKNTTIVSEQTRDGLLSAMNESLKREFEGTSMKMLLLSK